MVLMHHTRKLLGGGEAILLQAWRVNPDVRLYEGPNISMGEYAHPSLYK
jgi:hypothetical protein